jgi:hypothetical protein
VGAVALPAVLSIILAAAIALITAANVVIAAAPGGAGRRAPRPCGAVPDAILALVRAVGEALVSIALDYGPEQIAMIVCHDVPGREPGRGTATVPTGARVSHRVVCLLREWQLGSLKTNDPS